MAKYRIEFPETKFAAQEIEETEGLAEKLTIENSPVLFGCRTGICGTCLISIDEDSLSNCIPADTAEREVLDMIADHEPRARLACQLRILGDLKLRILKENP